MGRETADATWSQGLTLYACACTPMCVIHQCVCIPTHIYTPTHMYVYPHVYTPTHMCVTHRHVYMPTHITQNYDKAPKDKIMEFSQKKRKGGAWI